MPSSRQIWLPGLCVWAQTHQIRSLPCEPSASSSSHHQDSAVATDLLSVRDSRGENQEHTCPICLGNVRQSRVAVLWWCMHSFCVDCIERWSLLKRFCPLCKQSFHGWYYNIRGSSEFDEKRLAASWGEREQQPTRQNDQFGRNGSRMRTPRQCDLMQKLRPRATYRRSLPLQQQRRFRYSRELPLSERECAVAKQVLRWRASIYNRGLKAVPHHLERRTSTSQKISDPDTKARVERRLEPWIRRELQAILGEEDPSILIHFVLSLWYTVLACREERARVDHTSGTSTSTVGSYREEKKTTIGGEDNDDGDVRAVSQLKQFLDEKASAFWHELKCFADSPFTMKAYDSVVVYKKVRTQNDSQICKRTLE